MRGLPAWCVVAALLVLGCRTPTQVTVEVSTDMDCPDLRGTLITVGKAAQVESRSPVASTDACASGGEELNRIGSIVVVPVDEKDAAFGVKIVAGVDNAPETCLEDNAYEGCIVARRAMRFVPHESLFLPIPLRAACKDVPCTATTTCVLGTCVPAEMKDPERCVNSQACGEDSLVTGAGGGGGAGGAGGAGGQGGDGGSPPMPVCGDSTVDVASGEQCDDGNTTSGDGCSASCKYELSDGCGDVALALGTDPVVLSGDTTGTTPDDSASCGGGSAGEYIVKIEPQVAGMLHVTANAGYAAIFWVKDSCPGGTELHCESAAPYDFYVSVSQGATYYLGIDGSSGAVGTFDVQLVIGP